MEIEKGQSGSRAEDQIQLYPRKNQIVVAFGFCLDPSKPPIPNLVFGSDACPSVIAILTTSDLVQHVSKLFKASKASKASKNGQYLISMVGQQPKVGFNCQGRWLSSVNH